MYGLGPRGTGAASQEGESSMAVVGDMSKAKAVWRVSKADPPTPAARTAAPRASDNLVGAPTDAELAKSIKTAGNRPVRANRNHLRAVRLFAVSPSGGTVPSPRSPPPRPHTPVG